MRLVSLVSVVFLSLSQFNLVFSPISHTFSHTFLVFVFSLFIFSPGFLSPKVMTIFFNSHFVSWSSVWSQTFPFFYLFFPQKTFSACSAEQNTGAKQLSHLHSAGLHTPFLLSFRKGPYVMSAADSIRIKCSREPCNNNPTVYCLVCHVLSTR